VTFTYTGGQESYAVPDGVTSLEVEAVGANGANGANSRAPPRRWVAGHVGRRRWHRGTGRDTASWGSRKAWWWWRCTSDTATPVSVGCPPRERGGGDVATIPADGVTCQRPQAGSPRGDPALGPGEFRSDSSRVRVRRPRRVGTQLLFTRLTITRHARRARPPYPVHRYRLITYKLRVDPVYNDFLDRARRGAWATTSGNAAQRCLALVVTNARPGDIHRPPVGSRNRSRARPRVPSAPTDRPLEDNTTTHHDRGRR
jgi:hypothetical protein